VINRSKAGSVAERGCPSLAAGSSRPGAPVVRNGRRRWLRHIPETDGAQLLEFALSVPFLVVFLIGVADFGEAYNLKHIITNAAREAVRITVSNSVTSATCSGAIPCSIAAAADAARQYMINAGLSQASCINPGSPTSSGANAWTYSCGSSGKIVTLTIDRGYTFTGADGTVLCAQVTLSYPYTWTYENVIGLLVKGATASTATLTTQATMQILVQ